MTRQDTHEPVTKCRGAWLVGVFIIAYVIVDFIRRFVGGSQMPLMAVDGLMLICAIMIPCMNSAVAARSLSQLPWLWMGIVAFWAFCLAMSFVAMSEIIPIALSLRSYILPSLFCLVGMIVAITASDRQLSALERLLSTLLLISIIFAGFQIIYFDDVVGVAADLLSPMEHSIHSFGSEVVSLHSSFFSSSKRFGRFILASTAIILAIRYFRRRGPGAIPALAIIGTVLSGARESVFVAVAISTLAYFPLLRRHAIGSAVVASCVIFTIFYLTKNDSVALRLAFMLSDPEDALYRVMMLFPVFFPANCDASFWLGFGPGTYGQEIASLPTLANHAELLGLTRFTTLEFFGPAYNFLDSGLTKTILDIGVIGTLLFIFPPLFVSITIWRHGSFLVLSYLICFAAVILKSHTVLSDLGLMSLTWFLVGFSMARAVSRAPSDHSCFAFLNKKTP